MNIADWTTAFANLLLAVSILFGALMTLRRWGVAFTTSIVGGPFNADTSINGVPQPEVTTWIMSIELADGSVAHIRRIKLQRSLFPGFWRRVKHGLLPREHLPISISSNEKLEFTVVIPRGDTGNYRLKVDEYSTIRTAYIPFLEPSRGNDFS